MFLIGAIKPIVKKKFKSCFLLDFLGNLLDLSLRCRLLAATKTLHKRKEKRNYSGEIMIYLFGLLILFYPLWWNKEFIERKIKEFICSSAPTLVRPLRNLQYMYTFYYQIFHDFLYIFFHYKSRWLFLIIFKKKKKISLNSVFFKIKV